MGPASEQMAGEYKLGDRVRLILFIVRNVAYGHHPLRRRAQRRPARSRRVVTPRQDACTRAKKLSASEQTAPPPEAPHARDAYTVGAASSTTCGARIAFAHPRKMQRYHQQRVNRFRCRHCRDDVVPGSLGHRPDPVHFDAITGRPQLSARPQLQQHRVQTHQGQCRPLARASPLQGRGIDAADEPADVQRRARRLPRCEPFPLSRDSGTKSYCASLALHGRPRPPRHRRSLMR